MNVLKWATSTLSRKGALQTAKIIASFGVDLLFDWRHGTDTMRWVARDDLQVTSENVVNSHRYQATKSRPFVALLRRLQLPRDCNFVDIGAGKGRVLLMAAEYGFNKVVGIEFSPTLSKIARQNIEKYSRQHNTLSPMEVIEADAANHVFLHDDCVFFMFNPFYEKVMAAIMENLRRSLEERPRDIWLIYNTPVYDAPIRESNIFREHIDYVIGGTEFRVFSTWKEGARSLSIKSV